MQPNQQQDNVWISREEYERLRQQTQQPALRAISQPVVYGAGYQVADEPAKVKPIQAIIGATLAIGLFLSLTVPFFSIISVPILGIMLIFGVMSYNDFRKGRQQSATPTKSSIGTATENQKKGNGKYHALLAVLLIILAAPVLFIGGMIVLLIIFLAAGGGKGS
jgi:hypothetical protein